MITLKFKFGDEIKHNTYWKFNTSLLKDKQFVEEINTLIEEVVQEYSLQPKESFIFEDFIKSDYQLEVSDRTFLDFLLMKIRSKTIAYATIKMKDNFEKKKQIGER